VSQLNKLEKDPLAEVKWPASSPVEVVDEQLTSGSKILQILFNTMELQYRDGGDARRRGAS